ncbi:substrate-binding domain-containing protein [Rhodococcus koreensis]
MKLRTIVSATACALLTVGVVTGCGQPNDDGRLTIGVSYPTANSPFFKAYTDFIEEGGRQLGVDIRLVSADESEQKQLNDVQNLISQGADGLIVIPQSTSIARALLRTASQADVPVVVTDRNPGYDPGENDKADYVGFIGPNDEQAGRGIADALADAGGSKFLALGGVPGNSVAEGRKLGLENAIADKGLDLVQYQSAGDSEEKGLAATENLLQAHPAGEANAIWCFNDNLCQGSIRAAKNAGRADEFVFGGMDLTPQALDAIESGDYTVSYGGHWLEGGFGLAMLYDKLKGIDPKNPVVKLNLLAVDKSNVDEFKQRYVDNPPDFDFTKMTGGGDTSYQINLD